MNFRIFLFMLFSLICWCNFSIAQAYQRGDTTLNIFIINDTLKYFEFYSSGFLHENVEVGLLSRKNDTTYSLKYTNEGNFTPFEIFFQENSVSVKKLSSKGYMAYIINEKPFPKIKDSTSQIVSQFHLNYPIFYKNLNKAFIKVYEYPCFESKTKTILFRKGSEIEEKWKYGLRRRYGPIKNVTWIAADFGGKFIGWLLLSDVKQKFKKEL
ncbi:hypothetical protein [Rhizosphaericola mali]|uniref:GLPGLI family protein n=1 Tax=Rhizosphaericola mali TaxID=2545455 RepID=A0A5P2FXC1_9BACT|nr:hypothetical protein [Rhizosphaericola mali]QES88166.1 hypothetical protein E0W69_005625 [Rhizosphaericola mali]